MPKIKRLAGFLGLILLSQSDLISLHKHAKRRFHMNAAVGFPQELGTSQVPAIVRIRVVVSKRLLRYGLNFQSCACVAALKLG